MPAAKTEGNPAITHGDDDEWIANTLTRIDANLAALIKISEHHDEMIHRIDQALAPLREHEDAVARGLRLLDGRKLPAWMGGGKPKDGKV